jgi:hypothetical protein
VESTVTLSHCHVVGSSHTNMTGSAVLTPFLQLIARALVAMGNGIATGSKDNDDFDGKEYPTSEMMSVQHMGPTQYCLLMNKMNYWLYTYARFEFIVKNTLLPYYLLEHKGDWYDLLKRAVVNIRRKSRKVQQALICFTNGFRITTHGELLVKVQLFANGNPIHYSTSTRGLWAIEQCEEEPKKVMVKWVSVNYLLTMNPGLSFNFTVHNPKYDYRYQKCITTNPALMHVHEELNAYYKGILEAYFDKVRSASDPRVTFNVFPGRYDSTQGDIRYNDIIVYKY